MGPCKYWVTKTKIKKQPLIAASGLASTENRAHAANPWRARKQPESKAVRSPYTWLLSLPLSFPLWFCLQTVSRSAHIPHHWTELPNSSSYNLIIATPARVMTLKRKSHDVTDLWKACQWLAIRLGIKSQFPPPLILILSPLFLFVYLNILTIINLYNCGIIIILTLHILY